MDHLGNNRIVANASGEVVQSNEFYPFDLLMASSTNVDKQPYKYGSKELDSYNGLKLYDFEARYLDSSVPGFTTQNPLAEKYYSISPYAYVANNLLKFIDPDGRKIVGTDGKPVTYSTESGWSKNASADVQRVGNSLLKTETGTERLNYMIAHDENISITISLDIVKEGGGYSTGNNTRTGMKLLPDGSLTVGEHKITINEGSISKLIDANAGENQLKGLTMDEAIGVVAGHESGHTEKENTKQSYENNYKGANHDLEKKPNEIDRKIVEELKNKK